jgi:hypothetical protein
MKQGLTHFENRFTYEIICQFACRGNKAYQLRSFICTKPATCSGECASYLSNKFDNRTVDLDDEHVVCSIAVTWQQSSGLWFLLSTNQGSLVKILEI